MECKIGLVLLGAYFCFVQATDKNKSMYFVHSNACFDESKASPKMVDALFNGEFFEDPALKKHVYCMLHKCKMIGKDGKLLKTALMSKHLLTNGAGENVVSMCNETKGDLPEEIAYEFFKCMVEKTEKKFLAYHDDASAADDASKPMKGLKEEKKE